MITALAGGVGAAKFLSGLVKIVDPKDLSVVVNTGDDVEMYGLHVSPDLDIVSYTLAGIVDETKGWGIGGDTFNFLDALQRLGFEAWFKIGDRDLATNVYRTVRLKQGFKLSQVTAEISKSLGLTTKILPMTDDNFVTNIVTTEKTMHLQEYLVKRGARDEVLGVEFVGAATAQPADGVLEAIENSDLVVICPSNPVVSIGTILQVGGIRDALKRSKAQKVAISPIVAGAPLKGPADKLLRGLGFEVSASSVAKLYADFLDCFVIDLNDEQEKERIEQIGPQVKVTNIVMKNLEDKVQLAKCILELLH
ncbi:MAG: 2-phospho-L-lactate transferase [Candidatus Bathyarchaeota archaeon]|nr:2-phospho-L-lactate transferase [Candidatus Bathyarchaeota archaeon]